MDWGRRFVEALELLGATDLDLRVGLSACIEDAASLPSTTWWFSSTARRQGPAPFWFDRVQPSRELSFSSHSASPGQVVGLAREMFGAQVKAYALGIRGFTIRRAERVAVRSRLVATWRWR